MRVAVAVVALLVAASSAFAGHPVRCPCNGNGGVQDWSPFFTALWPMEKFTPSAKANRDGSWNLYALYQFLDVAQYTHNLTPGSFTGSAPFASTNALQGCHALQEDEVFNGSSQSIGGNVHGICVSGCTDGDFHFTGSFTVFCGAYPTVVPGDYIPGTRPGVATLLQNLGDPGPDPSAVRRGFALWYGHDQKFTFRMTPATGSGPFEVTTTPTFATGAYHFVAGRYQASARQSIAVDGTELASFSPVAPLTAWDGFMEVGFDTGNFIGQQDLCGAVNAALDDTSLCRLMVCGLDGCGSSTQSPCKCNAIDPTQYDVVPSHTCTLPACNAPTFTTLATVTSTSTSTSTSTTSTSTSTTSTSTSSTSTSTIPALTCTVLDHGNPLNSPGASSFTTASITPTANHLTVAWAINSKDSSTDTPTLSGDGCTWTQINTVQYDSTLRRITAFRTLCPSPTTGALTFDFGGQTQISAVYAVLDCSPVNTTTPVVQSATATGTSNNPTVTLSAFGSSNNLNLVICGGASSTMSAHTGWTSKTNDSATNRVITSENAVKQNDVVSQCDAGASIAWGVLGMEINHN